MRFLIFVFLSLCFINSAHSQYYGYSTYYRPYLFPYEINEARIQTRWRIQDAYKERNKTENYLDRKERMLDQAERAYELSKREEELRHKGILPPKNPNAGMYLYEGKKYNSYDEFKQSPDYLVFLKKQAEKEKLREQEKLIKEYEKKRDDIFLQMWHKMSDLGKEQFSRLTAEQKEQRIDEILLKEITE